MPVANKEAPAAPRHKWKTKAYELEKARALQKEMLNPAWNPNGNASKGQNCCQEYLIGWLGDWS